MCAFQIEEPFALRSTFTLYLMSSVCSAALVLISQHFKSDLSFPMDTCNFFNQSFESVGCGPEHGLSFCLSRVGCTACRVLVPVLIRPSCWAVPASQHWEISGSSLVYLAQFKTGILGASSPSNTGSPSRSWLAIRVHLPAKPGALSTHLTGSGMQPLLNLTGTPHIHQLPPKKLQARAVQAESHL